MKAANDNAAWPAEYLVGPGNVLWRAPTQPSGGDDEKTWAFPLLILEEVVSQALAAIKEADASGKEACVYVIGDIAASAVKIGMAKDPIARLAQLQTGNPSRLYLHRVFWVSADQAANIECDAHANAGASYQRLEGEWFSCTPNEAHEAIEQAIFDGRRVQHYCAMTPPAAERLAA